MPPGARRRGLFAPPQALPSLAHRSSPPPPPTRIQLFLIWFIDRSSYIDDTDLDWELYFMYVQSLFDTHDTR